MVCRANTKQSQKEYIFALRVSERKERESERKKGENKKYSLRVFSPSILTEKTRSLSLYIRCITVQYNSPSGKHKSLKYSIVVVQLVQGTNLLGANLCVFHRQILQTVQLNITERSVARLGQFQQISG